MYSPGSRQQPAGTLLPQQDRSPDAIFRHAHQWKAPGPSSRYEPHYTEITRSDQVQVYEAIMAGPQGKVTTGLLTAVRFLIPIGV